MNLIRSLLVPVAALCFLLLISELAFGQNCNAFNAEIQACELPAPYQSIDLNWRSIGQGDIPFRAVSRRCTSWFFICFQWQGVLYTVEVTPASGNNFQLSGANGSVPINLTYTGADGMERNLQPAVPTAQIPGTTSHQNVHMSVNLTGPGAGAPLLAGTYIGTFDLTLNQQGNCGNNGCQTDTVQFTIELVVPANIQISGLGDMTIDAPAVMSKAEDFCVFTQGGAAFGITADSATGIDAFQLEGVNTGDKITYTAEANTSPPGAPVPLAEGKSTLTLPGISWPGHPQPNCGGNGSNMRIVISLSPGALDNAIESTYTDTLTLTVELE